MKESDEGRTCNIRVLEEGIYKRVEAGVRYVEVVKCGQEEEVWKR